jgi:hypothetical protein
MAYIINRFDGTQLTIVDDGILDTTASLGLIGRNYTGYGEVQNENFIWLLENFAGKSPPGRALAGQIWYDNVNKVLKNFNGKDWLSIGNATVSETEPPQSQGGLWLKTATQQLFVSDGTTWRQVGPEAVEGFEVTKLTSTSLIDTQGSKYPVIITQINGESLSIFTNSAFIIGPTNPIPGFNNLVKGINLRSDTTLSGNVNGNADTATKFQTTRKINTVDFDGTKDIVVKSSTTKALKPGSFVLGSIWDGTFEDTWAIDASPKNLVGKIVSRDSNGDFAATTVTADLFGNVTGNVTAVSGTSTFNKITVDAVTGNTFTGNAGSATKLNTARKINTVPFDGTTDITLPVPAETLVGTSLAPNVTGSKLTSLGKLISLQVEAPGVVVGSGNNLNIYVTGFTPVIESENTNILKFNLKSGSGGGTAQATSVSLISSSASSVDGVIAPALVPDYLTTVPIDQRAVLGLPSYRWQNVYSNKLNADTLAINTLTGAAVNPTQGIPDQITVTNNLIVNGTTFSKLIGNVTGNVTGNLTGNVTGASSLNLLKSGDIMSGDLIWSTTGRGLNWTMNTDYASIRFYNTSDSDPTSRLEFQTGDNGNEYFSWTHNLSGSGVFETMRLTPNSFGASVLQLYGDATISGTVTATLKGQGNQITNLNASELGTGRVPNSRLNGLYNISIDGNSNTVSVIPYAQVINSIGYTPVNKAGDIMSGDLIIAKPNAWLTLDSPSFNDDGNYQAAGISIGESGYKGSATFHITYTGDGYAHIGMGPVDNSTSIPQYRSMRMYYLNNAVDFYGQINVPTVNATTLIGNGANITNLTANNLTGTIAVGRLSGSYNISISGNANTATTAVNLSGGYVSGTSAAFTGRIAQSTAGFQAAYADNITARLDSGFYQNPSPTVAKGWPVDGSWYHLLSTTHTNDANYYSMQFSADFYSQNLYYRSTASNGATAWNKILHSNNYNDYSPTKTGGGASGTWNINITGNANTVTSVPWTSVTSKPANFVYNDGGTYGISTSGNANSATTATQIGSRGTIAAESNGAAEPGYALTLRAVYNNGYPTQYGNLITLGGAGGGELLVGWSGNTGAHADNYVRSRRDTGNTWSAWAKLITDVNYNSYAPSLAGSGAYGTWGINITGNSATVSTLNSGQIASALGYTPVNPASLSNQSGGVILGSTGQFTQKLTVAAGAGYGIHWPVDSYGGSGDTARITLEAASGEATRMRFTMTNDADDYFEFFAPTDAGLKMNGNTVLHAANYYFYSPSLTGGNASGTWSIGITGNAGTVTSLNSPQIVAALGYTPANGSGPGNINGDQNYQDYLLRRATVIDYSMYHNSLGNISGSTVLNYESGNYASATCVGAVTWTFANPPTGQRAGGFILELTNGGSYTQYWPASVRWPAGTAPSLASSGVDVLVFLTDDAGANWRGAITMGDSR